MKTTEFPLIFALVCCVFAMLLTTSATAKEVGYYLYTGVSYWDSLDAPEFDGIAEVPGAETVYEVDGSRAQLSLGIGYNIDEQWGFEAFFVQTPDQMLSGTNWVIPPFEPEDEPFYLSWNLKREQTIVGAAAIYDIYFNEDFSFFGKAGIAFVQHATDFESVFSNSLDALESDQQRMMESTDDDDQNFFGAIGLRTPLMQTEGSLTFAYQALQTDDGLETSIELGVQWRF